MTTSSGSTRALPAARRSAAAPTEASGWTIRAMNTSASSRNLRGSGARKRGTVASEPENRSSSCVLRARAAVPRRGAKKRPPAPATVATAQPRRRPTAPNRDESAGPAQNTRTIAARPWKEANPLEKRAIEAASPR